MPPFPTPKSKPFRSCANFEAGDEPERQVFLTRPKMEGLWVSFRFRDGEMMEGIMPNNLLQVEPYGFTVIPPDSYGNQQRVFVPRTALQAVEVLGVVGSPLKRRKRQGSAQGADRAVRGVAGQSVVWPSGSCTKTYYGILEFNTP